VDDFLFFKVIIAMAIPNLVDSLGRESSKRPRLINLNKRWSWSWILVLKKKEYTNHEKAKMMV
jgi:hypothetical protein